MLRFPNGDKATRAQVTILYKKNPHFSLDLPRCARRAQMGTAVLVGPVFTATNSQETDLWEENRAADRQGGLPAYTVQSLQRMEPDPYTSEADLTGLSLACLRLAPKSTKRSS